MELLRVIREESGDFPKFESVLSKTTPDDMKKAIQDGRNILHIICASGYTKYAQLVLTAATAKKILQEMLDSEEERD
jgi:hypothetical protein